MSVDLSTLLVISASASAVGACVLLVSWLQNLKMRALGVWAMAFAFEALGIALIAARGKFPEFYSTLIAYAILTAAYGIVWTGVRSFEGRSTSGLLTLGGTLVWLVASQFEAFYGSPMARTALTSAIFVAYSVLSAVEIWRGRKEELISRGPIIVLFLGNVAFLLFRIPLVGSMSSDAYRGEISVSLFSFVIFETIFYTFSLVYMLGSIARERIAHYYRQASLSDPLTGIPNRRDFMQRFGALLARSDFEQRPSVLLLLDVDNFKSVNDTFGYQGGDQVLLEVSRLLASVLRPNHVFARLGGEEFGCLLPQASLKEGRDIADRIRARVEAALFKVAENTIGVTISVGLAVSAGPDQDLMSMMMAADRALYRAKANGRNRVECAPQAGQLWSPGSAAA